MRVLLLLLVLMGICLFLHQFVLLADEQKKARKMVLGLAGLFGLIFVYIFVLGVIQGVAG